MSGEGHAQRAVDGKPQQEASSVSDHAAGDAEVASPEGHHPVANGQAKAAVTVEDEKIAGEDLEGEVGGVRSEAARRHMIDAEVVLGFTNRALDVCSFVVEASDLLGSPVEIGDEKAVEVARLVEEATLGVVHLAFADNHDSPGAGPPRPTP